MIKLLTFTYVANSKMDARSKCSINQIEKLNLEIPCILMAIGQIIYGHLLKCYFEFKLKIHFQISI